MKLIHITDFHLQATPNMPHHGVDPERRLHAVLNEIKEDHDDCDLLLMTGDLVHHGYPHAYQRLEHITRHIAKQRCWIAGNHDCIDQIHAYVELAQSRITQNNWDILLLDSTSQPDGKGSGSLAHRELTRLAAFLDRPNAPNQLVALHHPPLPVGSAWQDAIRLANSDIFLEVLTRSASGALKLVVCGHLHQAHALPLGRAQMISTPATAAQFVRYQAVPRIETQGEAALPAYRWFELESDGAFRTDVVRVRVD